MPPPHYVDVDALIANRLEQALAHQSASAPGYYRSRPLHHVERAQSARQAHIHTYVSSVVFRDDNGRRLCTCGLVIEQGQQLETALGHRDFDTGVRVGVTVRWVHTPPNAWAPGFACSTCGAATCYRTFGDAERAARAHTCS
jgi:hypothetical protein